MTVNSLDNGDIEVLADYQPMDSSTPTESNLKEVPRVKRVYKPMTPSRL